MQHRPGGLNLRDEQILSSAYRWSLRVADQSRLTSVAFPLMRSITDPWHPEETMSIAIDAVNDFFVRNPYSSVKNVAFVCRDTTTYQLFNHAIFTHPTIRQNIQVVSHRQQQPDLTESAARLKKVLTGAALFGFGLMLLCILTRQEPEQQKNPTP